MTALDLSGIGKSKNLLETTVQEIINENIVQRIWKKDHTVWSEDPTEISNRLGWLDCVENSKKSLPEIYDFVESVKASQFKNVLVLGMGGSSLAPEVFSLIFGKDERLFNLYVLDSTHPEAIKSYAEKLDYKETLYIVSTKSGGTVETLSFLKFFYNFVLNHVGKEKVGSHFTAITDPGSGLQKLAEELNFRKIFLNDPNIGGRYSALSLFGLVPAALVGVDIEKLLSCAEAAVYKSKYSEKNKISENQAVIIGALIGALALEGKNKLTLLYSEQIKSFGAWLEQLIAESTGKIGKGILPVDLEDIISPDDYSNDRVFIYTHLKDDNPYDKTIFELKKNGFPVIEIIWDDIYTLGSEFFNWEFATAIAGWKMKLQPFDQPNVESAKVQARNLIASYTEKGNLQQPEISYNDESISIYYDNKVDNVEDAFQKLFSELKEGNYISIQSFVKPSEENFYVFQELRSHLLKKYKIPTTFGFGPRFLHSTGQLHKGDDGSGIFIQFIKSGNINLPIPDDARSNDSSITFDVLIKAQALGDREALLQNNRKVITFEINGSVYETIKKIIEVI